MSIVVQDGKESLFRAAAEHPALLTLSSPAAAAEHPALLTLSSPACHAHVRRDGKGAIISGWVQRGVPNILSVFRMGVPNILGYNAWGYREVGMPNIL